MILGVSQCLKSIQINQENTLSKHKNIIKKKERKHNRDRHHENVRKVWQGQCFVQRVAFAPRFFVVQEVVHSRDGGTQRGPVEAQLGLVGTGFQLVWAGPRFLGNRPQRVLAEPRSRTPPRHPSRAAMPEPLMDTPGTCCRTLLPGIPPRHLTPDPM